MLSRADYEALGGTDKDLEQQVRKTFGVNVELAGVEDSEAVQSAREVWVQQLHLQEGTTLRIEGAKLGAYEREDE